MNAAEFNKRYPVKTRFIYNSHPALRGGPIVKTVQPANDFKCGCIVEIDREPYFVKVESLQKAG